MPNSQNSRLASVPSVDSLLRAPAVVVLIEQHGRQSTTKIIRDVLGNLRQRLAETDGAVEDIGENRIIDEVSARLDAAAMPSLRRVFNLTGTVLHTNLGRAPLPDEAVEAMIAVATGASNLEYELESGKRGDRDVHVEELLRDLTGAEAATMVNNNAAAVFLSLNALAIRKEVPVSRGELVEIGGAFRIPDIMRRAGCKLVEVGTTNRTHARDYIEAINPKTALLMKVHTSNYSVEGFTKEVDEKEMAEIAHDHDIPFITDLGSGALIDMSVYGLPHEPTVSEAIANGADLVTFSGDKLLGGPQAGLIVGRKDLVEKIKKNPIKRATRLDKVTIAALSAVLQLYRNPDRLVERLPALRLLARSSDEIEGVAGRMAVELAKRLSASFDVTTEPCQSQIGSGSLPVERLDSYAVVLRPREEKGKGGRLKRLAGAFRSLPIAVVGRVQDDAFSLDVRCLENEAAFSEQLSKLPAV
ncbi:MAG: L-seryl-tRNA(Sec) selenium transferase [Proteobacteria bacterium]|nr:L-seryl-tRNA(Sec) selenium transferase [Pseudomonadota bacterium]